jgi:4-amino-4-deoxy-L-arabinose transferase-like glycosyltransferase
MEDQAPRHDAQNPAVRFIRSWMNPTPRREIAVWVFLILATIGIRVYLSHLVPAYLWSKDSNSYATSAFQWIRTGVWETDPRRGPVYSLVIALCLKIWGSFESLITLQHVLGGASVLLAIAVLRAVHGARAALACALCGHAYAVYGLSLGVEHLVRNETLLFVFATVAFAAWFLAIERDSAHWLWLCGISTGLLMLTKNVFGPFPLMVIGAQIWLHRSRPAVAAMHALIFIVALALPVASSKALIHFTVHNRPSEPQAGILFYGRTAQFTELDGGIEPEIKKLIRADIEAYRKLPKLDNNVILKQTAVPHMRDYLRAQGKTPADLDKLCLRLALEAVRTHKAEYVAQVIGDLRSIHFHHATKVLSPSENDLDNVKTMLAGYTAPDPLLRVESTIAKLDAAMQPHRLTAYRFILKTAWLFDLAPVLLTSLLLPVFVWRTRSAMRFWWLGAAAVWYFTMVLLSTIGRPLDRYLIPVAPIMFWTLGSSVVVAFEWVAKRMERTAG